MTKFKIFVIIMTSWILALTALPSFSQSVDLRADEVIDIYPKPDRTLLVRTTRGQVFRYHIEDFKPNTNCGVYEETGDQIKWMSHVGYQAFEYFTSKLPFAYQVEGGGEWIPLSAHTFTPQGKEFYTEEMFAEGVSKYGQ